MRHLQTNVRRCICALALVLVASIPTLCLSRSPTEQADPGARCKMLELGDYSSNSDAVTLVTSTRLVSASRKRVTYCEVTGRVSPSVSLLLRLPATNWNGKFLEIGCSGECGSTEHIDECDDPLRRGYACIVSDGGHRSGRIELRWAYNKPEAMADYLVLAGHVAALAGKMLAERFYSQAPEKSYFIGCSSGGVEGLLSVQKFPWDFDGVIAGAPDVNIAGVWMNLLWVNRLLMSDSGKPTLSKSDIETIHNAVVAQCDMNDGIKDGLIGDPRACHFDAHTLLCQSDKAEKACLTEHQVDVVNKIYRGPVTSAGEQVVEPVALFGSEKDWLEWYEGSSRDHGPWYNYIGDGFRYFLFRPNPGPAWTPQEFDFDRDYKRLGMAEMVEPARDPDLRRFKAAGGKLLLYTGWSDPVAGVLHAVDYYETVERILGGRAATQDFFRLFVIPGANHCRGGDGAFAVDYLTYLERWAEKGQAPEKLIGSHVRFAESELIPHWLDFPLDPSKVTFSRPIYPYPVNTKYLGHGDPNDASSYGPVGP